MSKLQQEASKIGNLLAQELVINLLHTQMELNSEFTKRELDESVIDYLKSFKQSFIETFFSFWKENSTEATEDDLMLPSFS